MFFLVLGALALLLAGSTILDGTLRSHPWWFLAFWGACAWLTLTAMLLAIWDLLCLRIAARAAERILSRQVLNAPTKANPDKTTNPKSDTVEGDTSGPTER